MTGRVPLRPEGQADLGVAELGEVADGEVHRRDVVVGDERGIDPLEPPVDEHDRQPALAQRLVAGRVGGRVGVLAGQEDDPGDPAVDEHLHVVVLVHPARGLRAQHRGEALGGQGRLDDLRERREDRVDELGHHEADEQGRLGPQPGRPVVAEHVDGSEHGAARGGSDPRPVVQHAADGRLADVGLGGDVGQARSPRLVHAPQSNNLPPRAFRPMPPGSPSQHFLTGAKVKVPASGGSSGRPEGRTRVVLAAGARHTGETVYTDVGGSTTFTTDRPARSCR